MNARLLLLAPLAVACLASSQEISKTGKSTEIGIFGGQGEKMLGSELRRNGFGATFGVGKPEPRFAIKGLPAQLVYEGYVLATHSFANSFHAAQNEFGVGGLAFARYRWARNHGVGAYFDAGIGLFYINKTDRDAPSHLNSTPYFGTGLSFPAGNGEWLLGVELLHISNAGTVNHNLGINLGAVSLKYRF